MRAAFHVIAIKSVEFEVDLVANHEFHVLIACTIKSVDEIISDFRHRVRGIRVTDGPQDLLQRLEKTVPISLVFYSSQSIHPLDILLVNFFRNAPIHDPV